MCEVALVNFSSDRGAFTAHRPDLVKRLKQRIPIDLSVYSLRNIDDIVVRHQVSPKMCDMKLVVTALTIFKNQRHCHHSTIRESQDIPHLFVISLS